MGSGSAAQHEVLRCARDDSVGLHAACDRWSNDLPYVYILASARRGTLYIGVTNDLVRRGYEHRNDMVPGFTADHGVHRLVYFEEYPDIRDAIEREKRLKRWRRAWKVDLVEQQNEDWHDLWLAIAY